MKGFKTILAAAASCILAGNAQAEISDDIVRIGVLNDISGVFQDTNGMGSVEAARMGAEDFNGGGKNIKVEIVYADHQNKADVGSGIARKWLGVGKVDAIVDVPNSFVGVAVNNIARNTKLTFLASSTATSDLTAKLLAEHHPVGQRRVGDWQHDGRCDDAARRLVLPHGQLCARAGHRSRSHKLHHQKMAARCSVPRNILLAPRTLPRYCCRLRTPKRRSLDSRTPVRIPLMPSSRPVSSGCRMARRSW